MASNSGRRGGRPDARSARRTTGANAAATPGKRATAKAPTRRPAAAEEASSRAPASALSVRVNGRDLPDADARALWAAFSEAMEAARGDATAFCRTRGFDTAVPIYERGRAVLVITSKPSGERGEPG